jgi:hypothetical protein
LKFSIRGIWFSYFQKTLGASVKAFWVLPSFCFYLFSSSFLLGGIYSSPTDIAHPIDPAIAANDPRLVEWANAIDPARTQFAPRGSTVINQAGAFNSLGDLDAAEIASGMQAGFLTITFPSGIKNGPGHDFAVFENGSIFTSSPFLFAELAFVEVSSNGNDFARFSSRSTNTEAMLDIGFGRGFASLDTTNVFNLAGKYQNGFGTPFELGELSNNPLVMQGLLDLNSIQYVKLVDIPGNGAFIDSQGNPILDAWLTSGGSGGFDFRLGSGLGVGVFNSVAVPEPASFLLVVASIVPTLLRRQRKREMDAAR